MASLNLIYKISIDIIAILLFVINFRWKPLKLLINDVFMESKISLKTLQWSCSPFLIMFSCWQSSCRLHRLMEIEHCQCLTRDQVGCHWKEFQPNCQNDPLVNMGDSHPFLGDAIGFPYLRIGKDLYISDWDTLKQTEFRSNQQNDPLVDMGDSHPFLRNTIGFTYLRTGKEL